MIIASPKDVSGIHDDKIAFIPSIASGNRQPEIFIKRSVAQPSK
jgi:hypothetical protein